MPKSIANLLEALDALIHYYELPAQDKAVSPESDQEAYQKEFPGHDKARRVMDFASQDPSLDLGRTVYVSIGGGDGAEIEYALTPPSPFKRGILLEYMDWAADKAKARAKKLKQSSRELIVITGDVAQKLDDCKQHLNLWRNSPSAPATGLLISAQAVLHELRVRADPRKFNFKKIFALFDGFETAIFHSREPTRPGRDTGWRDPIDLRLPGIEGKQLALAADLIQSRFKDQFDGRAAQEFCGDVFSGTDNWVQMPGLVAIELLHKLLRFVSKIQLHHEMEECLVALDPYDLQDKLGQAVAGVQFTRIEPTVTDGFQRLYLNSGVEARSAENSKGLPPPLAFSLITAFNAHRGKPIAGYVSPRPLTEARLNVELETIDAVVKRSRLFEPFLQYAIQRDVVFALGGVGSGLKTFLDQFQNESALRGARTYYSSVDFNLGNYEAIRRVRLEAEQRDPAGATHLELKCLLTALAYEVFCKFNREKPRAIQAILDRRWLASPASFADYYFGKSPALRGAETGPIVRFFFEAIQEAAKVVAGENVIVFMPLEELASCYLSDGERKTNDPLWGIGRSLWDALDGFSGTPGEFGKVCLNQRA